MCKQVNYTKIVLKNFFMLSQAICLNRQRFGKTFECYHERMSGLYLSWPMTFKTHVTHACSMCYMGERMDIH